MKFMCTKKVIFKIALSSLIISSSAQAMSFSSQFLSLLGTTTVGLMSLSPSIPVEAMVVDNDYLENFEYLEIDQFPVTAESQSLEYNDSEEATIVSSNWARRAQICAAYYRALKQGLGRTNPQLLLRLQRACFGR